MNRLIVLWLRVFVCLLALTMTGLAYAQEIPQIEIGQNISGEVSSTEPTMQFTLTKETSQRARVQVLSLSSDFFPTLRVVNPSGIEILNATNPEQGLIVERMVTLGEAGVYLLEVGSVGETAGQFVLSVQPGAPLPDPVELAFGQPLEAVVNSETPLQVYRFEGVANESVLLNITSESSEGSPVITLQEEETAHTLSTSVLSSTGMSELTYRFAAGAASYLLEVGHSGSEEAEAYRICLWTDSPPGACAVETTVESSVIAVSPTAQSQANPSATPVSNCTVTSATGGSINVRQGPGTNYPVVGNLSGSQAAPVIGRLSNNSWYQISYNGQAAWVGSTVVVLIGNCGGVPVAQAPALPTPATTLPAQPSATVMMTPTATLTGALTATLTATLQPSATATEPEVPPMIFTLQPLDTRADLIVISASRMAIRDANGSVIGWDFGSTILNEGFTDSGSFTVRACMNGTCIDRVFPSIPGGGPNVNTGYGVQKVSIGLETVNFLYEVYIDIYNDVNESDETNNLIRWEGTTQE